MVFVKNIIAIILAITSSFIAIYHLYKAIKRFNNYGKVTYNRLGFYIPRVGTTDFSYAACKEPYDEKDNSRICKIVRLDNALYEQEQKSYKEGIKIRSKTVIKVEVLYLTFFIIFIAMIPILSWLLNDFIFFETKYGRHDVLGNNTVCYTTTYGSCYHASGCQYLWNSSHKTTVYKAKKSGNASCSKCDVGILDKSKINNYKFCTYVATSNILLLISFWFGKEKEKIYCGAEYELKEIESYFENYKNQIIKQIHGEIYLYHDEDKKEKPFYYLKSGLYKKALKLDDSDYFKYEYLQNLVKKLNISPTTTLKHDKDMVNKIETEINQNMNLSSHQYYYEKTDNKKEKFIIKNWDSIKIICLFFLIIVMFSVIILLCSYDC